MKIPKPSYSFQFSTFSPKQKKVLTWWTKESPFCDCDGVIADGAIRSGKTVSMSISFVMWAMENFSGQTFTMSGKTVGSFRRNVLQPLISMLSALGYNFTDRRTDNLLIIRKGQKENYFYIFGGKDESSQNLIQGITSAGAFFDEVALMPESFVTQATARCSVKGSKFWFNCNPEGVFHWFKKDWIDKADKKNLLYLHFTMEDNYSLSDEIKKRYRAQYSGLFYKRYIDGLWAVAEGLIYDMWDEKKHVIHTAAMPGDCYISCDYGTQNALVFLMWKKAGNLWICEKEYYYSGRDRKKQKTDSEYFQDLEKFIGGNRVKSIIVDPSAASFIAEIRKHGYRVQKAVNDVSDGIRHVSGALERGLIVFDESCQMTRKEFVTYAWDPKAAARGEDKPIKDNDHCMDAVRYFVSTEIYRKKAALNTGLKGGL